MIKNWKENKNKCKEICEKNPHVLSKKTTKGDFTGIYITWTFVYKWLVQNYDFNFEVLEVKTSIDGSSGFVKARLTIYADTYTYSQTLALTLETFKRANGEFYQESPEQLQMRVFVKLVANLTGFGFHLWEK